MKDAKGSHRENGGCEMEVTVQVDERGALILPAEVVNKLHLMPGDTLHLLDLGGVFVLGRAPSGPSVSDLALEIEAALRDSGSTMDEMLASLREERKRYVAEKYGIDGA